MPLGRICLNNKTICGIANDLQVIKSQLQADQNITNCKSADQSQILSSQLVFSHEWNLSRRVIMIISLNGAGNALSSLLS